MHLRQLFVFILGISLFSSKIYAQGIAINEDGSAPNNSAILDVQSTSKGMLVPKMTTHQKTMINNPATGLLVFDTSEGGFYFYDGSGWVSLSESSDTHQIMDADGDTRVSVEEENDEDKIRFFIKGEEKWRIEKNRIENIGSSNVFIGRGAGDNTIASAGTGHLNTFVGDLAGFENTTGTYNAFFGTLAGHKNIDGSANSFFGHYAGTFNTTGSSNSFFGYLAGQKNTTGEGNSFFGSANGRNNTTGNNNSFFGVRAGDFNTTGGNNSFFGYATGEANTMGQSNSFFGQNSGNDNTTGNNNSFFGQSSGSNNTTGNSNSFFGQLAGSLTTTASNNSFFGKNAGAATTTGNSNSFFGKDAGETNTTGHSNTYFGLEAGENATGDANAIFGARAGETTTTGGANAFFGRAAGANHTSGEFDTFIGYTSGVASGSPQPNNSVALGNNVRVTASNQVRIGNTSVNDIGGYAEWTDLSDARFKTNIQENITGLDFIKKLRPITYKIDLKKLNEFIYGKEAADTLVINQQKAETHFSGFLAQEVEAAAREIGYDFSGVKAPKHEKDHYGLRYAKFVVPMVKAMQEQQEIIESAETQIQKLTEKLQEAHFLMEQLSSRVLALEAKN